MRTENSLSIKAILSEMVRELRLGTKLNEARIQEKWSQIVGNSIANHTEKIELRQQTLVLYIASSSLKQELLFSKEKIITLVNDALKEKCIKEILIY